MQQLICIFKRVSILIMLLITSSMHGMETQPSPTAMAGRLMCKLSELCNQTELCNQEHDSDACFIIKLPTELFPSIQSLKKNIKFFMKLSSSCKKFNRLLTVEEIGKRCKDYSQNYKNEILNSRTKDCLKYVKNGMRLAVLSLVCAGAHDAQLLEKSVIKDDAELAEILFKYDKKFNARRSISSTGPFCFQDRAAPLLRGLSVSHLKHIPLLFAVKSVKMAKLFIANGANIHAINHDHMNILWNAIDNSYPVNLMEFYLIQGVDTTPLLIKSWNGTCIEDSLLHRFAATPYSGKFNDLSNFLEKAKLLLTTLPDQINAVNMCERTPLDIVEESLKRAKKGDNQAAKIAFKALIGLFYEYNGLTAERVSGLRSKVCRQYEEDFFYH